MSSRKVRSIPLFSPQSQVLPFNSAAFSGRVLFVVTLSLLLAGCDSQRKLEEVKEFIAAVKLAQVPSVLPPPTLAPARRYVYSSAGARSPFERPPTKTNDRENSQLVAPDFARQREALEEFPDFRTYDGRLSRAAGGYIGVSGNEWERSFSSRDRQLSWSQPRSDHGSA